MTAKVASSLTGNPTPSGTVSFYDGTTLLGSSTLASGTATFAASGLAVGTHTVKAVYSGDTHFNPATSSTSSIAVADLAAAITLAGTPTTLNVTGGSQGIVTLAIGANARYAGAVTLACSGMPANGTCSINPGSVTLTAGGTTTATLVIGTSSAHAELHRSNNPGSARRHRDARYSLRCVLRSPQARSHDRVPRPRPAARHGHADDRLQRPRQWKQLVHRQRRCPRYLHRDRHRNSDGHRYHRNRADHHGQRRSQLTPTCKT
ncbi:Ig-like domain-containing protein [Granulicella cerasi]|uniref:Ig-like domain-containing protein n=1 Tax=Granulicella cerasi TaxID=741063 RepID=A0ABW1Z7A0_9BACT